MSTTFIKKAETAKDFQTQINELNTKLNAVAKNLTYFDFYNIVDVAVNKNNFSAQVNSLTPNTSLIINSEPFFLNDVYYNTGDIIFKSSNNNIVHIKAQTGGIYYPYKITLSNNSYLIEYKYTSTQPRVGSSTDDEEETKNGVSLGANVVGGAKETIKFTGLTVSTPGTVYGLWQLFSNSFSAYKNSNNIPIQPYIKFYLYDEKNNIGPEEICLDYSLTFQDDIDNPTWIVEIKDSVNEILENLWMKVK